MERVKNDNGRVKEVTVWDVDGIRQFDDDTFRQCLQQGVDHGTCVAFTLNTASQDNIRLLGLTAAGHSTDEGGSTQEDSDADDVGGVMAIESETEDETDAQPVHIQELQWLDASGQVTDEQHILQMLQRHIRL